MSSSSESWEPMAMLPENPSLLSQFLKDNGSFGDLNRGIACNFGEDGNPLMLKQTATTMNLFPMTEKQPLMNLFPEETQKENVTKKADSSCAPMTIFYGGKMFVFNNFRADKAEEIMALASKGSREVSNNRVTKPMEPRRSQSPPSEIFSPSACRVIPLARKASLQRFLEKRKDRINGKAPYQTETKYWLGLVSRQT